MDLFATFQNDRPASGLCGCVFKSIRKTSILVQQVKFPEMRQGRKRLFGCYIFSIILVLVLSAWIQPLHAATYYISSTGSDSNPGTQEEPWLTIGKAFKIVTAGDTVNIASGTYSGTAITSTSGSSGSLITITGQADQSTIITGSWTINNSYYVITNLYFNGATLKLSGTEADHNNINSNKFANYIQGVYMLKGNADNDCVNSPSYNTITNNEFLHAIGDGSVVTMGTDNVVSSNNFHDLDGWDALRVWGVGTIIKDNTFTKVISGPDAGHTNHADIIQTFTSSTGAWAKNVIFERNKLVDCTAQFGNIETTAGSSNIENWTFKNNLLINSRAQINIYAPNFSFYNNTVIGNTFVTGFRFAYSDTTGSADNGKVFNNIFIRCEAFYSFSASTTGGTYDYNFYTSPTDESEPSFPESHGINGGYTPNQVFVDPDHDDFRLVAFSPAINAGIPIPIVVKDIALNDRRTKTSFDIGAYMFVQQTDAVTVPPAAPKSLTIIK